MENINKSFAIDFNGRYEDLVMTYTLIKSLPAHIYGSVSKDEDSLISSWTRTKPTIVALKYDKWISYNSKERISLMLFDLDRKEADIKSTFQKIKDITKNIPAWLIETDNGYQFAYVLENHVFTNHQKSFNFLRAIKQKITQSLKCDESSSMRNTGFFRNPLASKNSIFNGDLTVELTDFSHLLPKYENKKKKHINTKVVYKSTKNYIQGNRHHFMCIRALEIAKKYESISQDQLTQKLLNYHDMIKTNINKLDDEDIASISKWAFSISSKNQILEKIGQISKDITPSKPRELKSIFEEYQRHLSDEEFKLAVRKRRQEQALVTCNIRPKNHLEKLAKTRQKTAIKKIKKIVKCLQRKRISVSQTSIIKYAKDCIGKGVGRVSVKRYLESV